jgi:hypothetical protein
MRIVGLLLAFAQLCAESSIIGGLAARFNFVIAAMAADSLAKNWEIHCWAGFVT